MIDSLVAVIDRFIKLAEYRNRGLRVVFDELITPIFADVTAIHLEYGRLLESIQRLLPDSERDRLGVSSEMGSSGGEGRGEIKDIDEVMRYLRVERQRFEPVRVRLVHMLLAVDYSELEPPSARLFFDSVIRYFPRGCGLAELWKLPHEERWSVPESTAGLLAADDNWSKRLMDVIGTYRRALTSRGEETEREARLELIEFFLRQGYSEVCSTYANLKMELVRRKA